MGCLLFLYVYFPFPSKHAIIEANKRREAEDRMTEQEKAMAWYLFRSVESSLKAERDLAKDLCYRLNQYRPSDQGGGKTKSLGR